MRKYRIVSFDGGGIAGILSARILHRLSSARPGMLSKTNLYAGTSTGAMLAVGLAKGLAPGELVELYLQKSPLIFRRSLISRLADLWGVVGAKYDTKARLNGLKPTFGEVRLGQLQKKILVAAFDLESIDVASDGSSRRWSAKFFHNFPRSSALNENALDVIMRSTAAPTFFPIYEGYIDGGVVANNPSMCAVAQAINPQTGKQRLENLIVLSIGTGSKPQFISSRDGDWGLKQWGFQLIDLLLNAGAGLADYQCRQLLGDRYLRIDLPLSRVISLDAVKEMDDLIRLADETNVDQVLQWIDRHWM